MLIIIINIFKVAVLTSDATSAGESTIQVYFNLGVDPNIAMVNVKTRVDQMMSRLPDLARLEGVIVNFVQPSMLMYVNFYSKDKNADQKLLFNYAYVNVQPLPILNESEGTPYF